MRNHADNVWSWSQDDDGAFVVKDSCRHAVAYDISLFRDARLIAAAPELLEALENILFDSECPARRASAIAAIAKAKGE